MDLTLFAAQVTLDQLGFHPGPQDGINGRRTAAAIKAFQAIQPMRADGLLTPETITALAKAAASRGISTQLLKGDQNPLPPWMAEAKRFLGLREVAGKAHNPIIISWAQRLGAKVLGITVADDETPWCGLFVAHCISLTLPAEPMPSVAVRASSWDKFGLPCSPTTGAVLRFERPGGGHVAFYNGESADAYRVTGGNQGNAVTDSTWIEKDRLVSCRWPKTAPWPTTGKVALNRDGSLSQDEA